MLFYIESTDGFALQGNGWYCDSVIDKALNYKLRNNVRRYQVSAKSIHAFVLNKKQPNHFKQCALEVYHKFECPKQAITGFIGLSGKPHFNKTSTLFRIGLQCNSK